MTLPDSPSAAAIRDAGMAALSRLIDLAVDGTLGRLLDELDTFAQAATERIYLVDGCPCLLTEPCSSQCTCANPHHPGGCHRCAKYGNIQQRRAFAIQLAAQEATTEKLRKELALANAVIEADKGIRAGGGVPSEIGQRLAQTARLAGDLAACRRERDSLRAELTEAWGALGISDQDRLENDDPDCETLAQCIKIEIEYWEERLRNALRATKLKDAP